MFVQITNSVGTEIDVSAKRALCEIHRKNVQYMCVRLIMAVSNKLF